jgi:hypothetical protein
MEPENPSVALARRRICRSLKETVNFIELNVLFDLRLAISRGNLLDHPGFRLNKMQMLAPSLLGDLGSQIVIGCVGRDSEQHVIERLGIFGCKRAELSVIIRTERYEDVLEKIVDNSRRKTTCASKRSNYRQRDRSSKTAQELLPGWRVSNNAVLNQLDYR